MNMHEYAMFGLYMDVGKGSNKWHHNAKAFTGGFLWKKAFLKVFQYLLEKTPLVESLFLVT